MHRCDWISAESVQTGTFKFVVLKSDGNLVV